jgi:hypothetical protein
MTAVTKAIDSVGRVVEERTKVVADAHMMGTIFFALACALNDLIPVCHYVLRCDHRFGH